MYLTRFSILSSRTKFMALCLSGMAMLAAVTPSRYLARALAHPADPRQIEIKLKDRTVIIEPDKLPVASGETVKWYTRTGETFYVDFFSTPLYPFEDRDKCQSNQICSFAVTSGEAKTTGALVSHGPRTY